MVLLRTEPQVIEVQLLEIASGFRERVRYRIVTGQSVLSRHSLAVASPCQMINVCAQPPPHRVLQGPHEPSSRLPRDPMDTPRHAIQTLQHCSIWTSRCELFVFNSDCLLFHPNSGQQLLSYSYGVARTFVSETQLFRGAVLHPRFARCETQPAAAPGHSSYSTT
ncbi:hypothetical protein BC629DRAFT_37719 [Irpex lacteus]|nr:hypothetical protein BC629DRAFT_37719 [Irpex lacteus]